MIHNESNEALYTKGTSQEKEIESEKTPAEAMDVRNLFRYASFLELVYILLATIVSVGFGICLPLALIVFGDIVDSFTDRATRLCSLNLTSLAERNRSANITLTTINFYTETSHKTGQLILHLTDDTNKFRMVLVISFWLDNKNELSDDSFRVHTRITIITCDNIICTSHFHHYDNLFKVITKMAAVELKAFGKAGIVAEEVISSIRTVLAYNEQEKEIHRSVPSEINMDFDNDLTKYDLEGDIQFSNVYFFYSYGQTVALVGSFGSGKSTSVQLLQRLYNPQSGSILIDGKEAKEYNLKWLREHIGVANQESVLFHKTIRKNILFGFDLATDKQCT
ncbi:unnamed protein product [Rotaria magnacalcarata]|uniref:ABC transporter domain-containing protein n=2 Tax=Rotaria magnacalcarata TaxID=392030 RepID=A0A819H4B1_9BILA|nr:unnamed protein product [Rotaria magnacalcarata]CAF3894640.1 unnamed protein product [Rotaria magnacalcarata]CAF3947515.1 unnamed protein product [Rotaria magnacalcarata]